MIINKNFFYRFNLKLDITMHTDNVMPTVLFQILLKHKNAKLIYSNLYHTG